MFTDAQLQQIMPNLAAAKRALYLAPLNAAMGACGIDSKLRCAAFIAQLAHESGEFRWMQEIWGPTAAQLRYEPPGDLAKRLGNTQPGDGKRFMGRGPIQITGRFNYKTYGDLLGIDLTADPVRAAAADLAFATAALFWQRNGLNELADAGQFIAITKRINGGTNGLTDRQMYYERAQAVLMAGPPRGAARTEPLMRGHEAIVAAAATPAVVKKVTARKATAKKPAVKAPVAKKAVARRKA